MRDFKIFMTTSVEKDLEVTSMNKFPNFNGAHTNVESILGKIAIWKVNRQKFLIFKNLIFLQ